MKSVLSELFSGTIYPDEQIVPEELEYRQLNDKISNEMEYFEKKLSKEDFNRLENLYGLYSDSSSLEREQSFIYGYKLGSLLMIEVLKET